MQQSPAPGFAKSLFYYKMIQVKTSTGTVYILHLK